jgi:hypothetical protein
VRAAAKVAEIGVASLAIAADGAGGASPGAG